MDILFSLRRPVQGVAFSPLLVLPGWLASPYKINKTKQFEGRFYKAMKVQLVTCF